jgi:cell division FtsZ-interacting protein ZapD
MGAEMKIPSEAELIEMEQRFDLLTELAGELRQSEEERRRLEILETDPERLESLRQEVGSLIELVRSGVLGAR